MEINQGKRKFLFLILIVLGVGTIIYLAKFVERKHILTQLKMVESEIQNYQLMVAQYHQDSNQAQRWMPTVQRELDNLEQQRQDLQAKLSK